MTKQDVDTLKAELLGPTPGVLDRLLATTVVVANLSYLRAARAAAKTTAMPGMAGVRDRNLSAAQKRLLTAIRGYQQIGRLKGKGVKPKGKLKLFEPGAGVV